MDRRGFFNSLSSLLNREKKTEPIRPPYCNNHSLFEQKCIDCDGKCLLVCEENIIKIGEDKTPYLDFSVSGCTFCEECLKVCDEVLNDSSVGIIAKTSIDLLKCLSWNNTMCFSCKDPCPDNAIKFQGLFRPEINENCTNCGFCFRVCPTNAIEIKR